VDYFAAIRMEAASSAEYSFRPDQVFDLLAAGLGVSSQRIHILRNLAAAGAT
jgi:hypothetical protein